MLPHKWFLRIQRWRIPTSISVMHIFPPCEFIQSSTMRISLSTLLCELPFHLLELSLGFSYIPQTDLSWYGWFSVISTLIIELGASGILIIFRTKVGIGYRGQTTVSFPDSISICY